MSLSKLHGDVLLEIVRHIDDETLMQFAQAWKPVADVLSDGQSTKRLQGMTLEQTMMTTGPASIPRHDMVRMIRSYSVGWTELRYNSQKTRLIKYGNIRAQWNTGSVPIVSDMMGESGGCLYFVTKIGRNKWWVWFFKPPSRRTNSPLDEGGFSVNYEIAALAIDATREIIVILRKPFNAYPYTGIAQYNFLDYRGNPIRKPFTWYPDFQPGLIVRQLEIVDSIIGLLVQNGHETEIHFFDLAPSGEVERYFVPRPSFTTFWSFQFIREDVFFILEKNYHVARLRMEEVGGRNPKIIGPYSNYRTYDMDLLLEFSSPSRGAPSRITFVPYIAPISGQHPGTNVPFYFDPERRLIALKCEYRGFSMVDIVIFELLELLQHNRPRYLTRFSTKGEGFTLNGRHLLWSRQRGSSHRIYALDYNPNAKTLGFVPGSIRHPTDQTWVVGKEQGADGAIYTYTTPVQDGATRVVFTQDNIMFIKPLENPNPLNPVVGTSFGLDVQYQGPI